MVEEGAGGAQEMLVSVREVGGGPRKREENQGPPIVLFHCLAPPTPSLLTPAAVENGSLFMRIFSLHVYTKTSQDAFSVFHPSVYIQGSVLNRPH